MTNPALPEKNKRSLQLSPPESHRQTIVRTLSELADERQNAAEREEAIIELLDVTGPLTGSPDAMPTAGAERIARRPDRMNTAIDADVKNTQWPRVFIRAIENPTHERWLEALKTTAVQTASTDGTHSDETAALLTAIIHAMEPEDDHSVLNTQSMIELAAAIGRSRIEQWQAPRWWPEMIEQAALAAMDQTMQYIGRPITNGNQIVFSYNTEGMLLPTTRQMNSLEKANYLLEAGRLSGAIPQESEHIKRFYETVRPVEHEWWEGVIRRFPERILHDDYNYHTLNWAETSPDARETILQAMSSISERYPNAENETERRLARRSQHQDDDNLESIRTILRQTHPEDMEQLATGTEPQNRYSENAMSILSNAAMHLCRPGPESRQVEEDPLLLATMGRMLRISHIAARQSREMGLYAVTIPHLQDAKEITAVIPIGTVHHEQRERMVDNIEQQAAGIKDISSLPNE